MNLLDAQRLLSTVSDNNTDATLSYVSGIINKVLADIFPNSEKRIYLEKKLFAGTKPHIVVRLDSGNMKSVDMMIQSGIGLCQIISVLFVICLIEVRKGRRLVILDERFNGLHPEAKKIIGEIIKIFAEGGFQFFMVEYGMNIGKLYNVEKIGMEAKVYDLDGVDYNDTDVYLFSDVDLSLVDKDYVDDEEGYVGTVRI